MDSAGGRPRGREGQPRLHGSGEVDKRYDRSLRIGMYRLPQFRKEFKVAKPVRRAVAYVSGLGHFDMYLNGEKVGDHFLDPGWSKYEKEALYVPFDVTEYLRDGDNAVGVMLGNGFFNIPGASVISSCWPRTAHRD